MIQARPSHTERRAPSGQSVRVWVIEAEVGEAGLAYVRARLEGGLSLSKAVLGSVDLDAGHVVAIVPVDHPDIQAFGRGAGSPGRFANETLRAAIRGLFERHSAAAIWAEEPLPRRSDQLWRTATAAHDRAWFLDDEVYSLAFSDDDNSRLLDAIDAIYDFPGWGGGGFVTTDQESLRYRNNYELQRGSLNGVADATVCIVCGAYDGEGFVLWNRD